MEVSGPIKRNMVFPAPPIRGRLPRIKLGHGFSTNRTTAAVKAVPAFCSDHKLLSSTGD